MTLNGKRSFYRAFRRYIFLLFIVALLTISSVYAEADVQTDPLDKRTVLAPSSTNSPTQVAAGNSQEAKSVDAEGKGAPASKPLCAVLSPPQLTLTDNAIQVSLPPKSKETDCELISQYVLEWSAWDEFLDGLTHSMEVDVDTEKIKIPDILKGVNYYFRITAMSNSPTGDASITPVLSSPRNMALPLPTALEGRNVGDCPAELTVLFKDNVSDSTLVAQLDKLAELNTQRFSVSEVSPGSKAKRIQIKNVAQPDDDADAVDELDNAPAWMLLEFLRLQFKSSSEALPEIQSVDSAELCPTETGSANLPNEAEAEAVNAAPHDNSAKPISSGDTIADQDEEEDLKVQPAPKSIPPSSTKSAKIADEDDDDAESEAPPPENPDAVPLKPDDSKSEVADDDDDDDPDADNDDQIADKNVAQNPSPEKPVVGDADDANDDDGAADESALDNNADTDKDEEAGTDEDGTDEDGTDDDNNIAPVSKNQVDITHVDDDDLLDDSSGGWFWYLATHPLMFAVIGAVIFATAVYFLQVRGAPTPSNIADAGFMPVSTIADTDDHISGPNSNTTKRPYLDSDDEDLHDLPSKITSPTSATDASNNALVFVENVLSKLGIPSYGQAKYTSALKDNYLNHVEQLAALDAADWKRLGWPLVIEEAVRKAVVERKQANHSENKTTSTNTKRSALTGALSLKPSQRRADSSTTVPGSVAVTVQDDYSDSDEDSKFTSKKNKNITHDKSKSKLSKKTLVAASSNVESDDELDLDKGWDDF